MTLSAIKELNKWEKAFSSGNTSELEEMLAEDYVFENNKCKFWKVHGGIKK